MKITNELKELFLRAEKVSEFVKVKKEKDMIKVLASKDSMFYTAGIASTDTEETEFILDKNSINLLKTIDPCEEILITTSEEKINIKGGATKATLAQLDTTVAEYNINTQKMVGFDISMIKEVLYACGVNMPAQILNGISFKIVGDDIEVATTDSSRVAVTSIPISIPNENTPRIEEGTSFVIFKNDITKLLSIMQGTVYLLFDEEKSVATFLQGNNMVSVSCMDGMYPPYGEILNQCKTPFSIILDKDVLSKNINRCSLIDNQKITLKISKNKMDVISKSNTMEIVDSIRLAKSNLDKELEIHFNLKYLNEMINAVREQVEDDEISIELNTSELPIKCILENSQHILLPAKINK